MFITFEGPDGSGKTRQIKPAADFLESKGYTVFIAREPGGTSIGDQVRDILMNIKNTGMVPRAEIFLFCAARAQLVDEVILPHLDKGEAVLLDRYADSTMAYQGYGHQYDLALIRDLLRFATGGLRPDLTFLLDIDPRVGLSRKQQGGKKWNRLEEYQLDYHQRVRSGYLNLAKQEPDRWRIINSEQPPRMVQSDIQSVLLLFLSNLSN